MKCKYDLLCSRRRIKAYCASLGVKIRTEAELHFDGLIRGMLIQAKDRVMMDRTGKHVYIQRRHL